MRRILMIACLVCQWGHAGQTNLARADGTSASAQPRVKKATVASVVIRGDLPESVSQPGLFGQMEVNLAKVISRLDKAAADKSVSALLLRIRNPIIGRGKLAELRAAIGRVRQSGKRVYAEIHSATTGDYLLACACDEIFMPESGVLMITGVRAEVTFYKRLLDKIGIQADMLQVGKFKGAAEPATRDGMSDEFRRQYELLLDDMYDQMVETIAADRQLVKPRVRELIDTGLMSAAEAKAAGLIDGVAYDDQLEQTLKQRLAAEQVVLMADYGRKKVNHDLSGMMGFMKLFELMSGGNRGRRATAGKKIAVVYASGVIMPGNSASGIFGTTTLGSDTIVKALRQAAANKTVAAIVLRVDSPGGSALASDLIWRQIVKIDKPVVASMGDTAASGGYYISMGCDKIVAEPGTLTGSIGVVGGKMVMRGLNDKIGLSTEVISRGKNSGIFSSEAPFTDSERQVAMKWLHQTYDQFVSKAAAGRKMDPERLNTLAEGRVWTGRQAKANGLVDQLGTLNDAVAAARQLAGIAAGEKTELLILPEPKTFFDQLMEGSTIHSPVKSGLEALAPGASRHLEEIETLRRLFAEPSVLIMPYRVEIK